MVADTHSQAAPSGETPRTVETQKDPVVPDVPFDSSHATGLTSPWKFIPLQSSNASLARWDPLTLLCCCREDTVTALEGL